MTNSEIMKKIMLMYKFEIEMTDEDRANIFAAKNTVLVSILKKYGIFGIMTAVSIKLYFISKKWGISIAISKIYTAIVGTAIIIACSLTATGFVVLNNRFLTDSNPVSAPANIIKEPTAIPVNSQQNIAPVVQYKIELMKLNASPELVQLSNAFTQALHRSLSSRKGNAFAVISDGSGERATPMILAGSILKMGEIITINIRLVDSSTSKVLMMISEKIASENESTGAAERIADKIIEKI